MNDIKEVQIYVRGRKHLYPKEKIRYREVVNLGYPNGKHGPLYEYDVSWKDGPKEEEEGTLKEGESVRVIDGMRFDVKFTDRS
ncbi:MAG: multiubiquitin domain-containing protein [Gammaproteobacteria bacterium]|nr:multiubiquitin domain-containing protein [Gammaproteobacteria bacterium]